MASSSDNPGTSPSVDPAREFLEFWRNYFEQTAIQTRILFETMQGGKSFEQLHSQWLGALSESLDKFMRTPAFLEVLKQTLKRMIELKRLQDQTVQGLADQTGLPLVPDIAGLFERVSSAEHVILKRLEHLEGRLNAIEAALNVRPAEKKNPSRKKEQAAEKEVASG